MASRSDLEAIMGVSSGTADNVLTKEKILGLSSSKSRSGSRTESSEQFRRPEGMARELYNLIRNDANEPPPLIPTDVADFKDKGYKQLKAKLGMRRVRPWKWMAFTNPARRDDLVLHHWRRVADEGKEYAFAKFNRRVEVASYTDMEYRNHLVDDKWTRAESDHLIDLAQRFDLRFIVMQDRWDRERFGEKSVEDLKERYYAISDKMDALHVNPAKLGAKTFVYDADHERRRKEQLDRLLNRTPEQVEEEERLRVELKKIEARKKDRERKTQDLQKLIAQADNSVAKLEESSSGVKSRGSLMKKRSSSVTSESLMNNLSSESTAIKFFDPSKTPGPSIFLMSQKMKLPPNLGQKRTAAIDGMVRELNIGPVVASERTCEKFNDLRSDMALLYELKLALANCEAELHSLKAQYEAICPGKSLEIPSSLISEKKSNEGTSLLSDLIDVPGKNGATPVRKRKAALEQSNVLKKLKKSV